MENLKLYNNFREVPQQALKPITAGRLKGKSDINPMWRIETLTKEFGVCGIGWKYEIVNKWLEHGADGEVSAFMEINLYIKYNGEWSAPIPGIGGSSFVTKESKGMYTSDECYKMALTDALSVSCKALGMAADVYYAAGATKYTKNTIEYPNTDNESLFKAALQDIDNAKTINELKDIHSKYPSLKENKDFLSALTKKKESINAK